MRVRDGGGSRLVAYRCSVRLGPGLGDLRGLIEGLSEAFVRAYSASSSCLEGLCTHGDLAALVLSSTISTKVPEVPPALVLVVTVPKAVNPYRETDSTGKGGSAGLRKVTRASRQQRHQCARRRISSFDSTPCREILWRQLTPLIGSHSSSMGCLTWLPQLSCY